MLRRAPELVVAAAVAAVYVGACCSVVVCEGLSAGPFDLAAVTGFGCVLTGWTDYPFAWLANPLVWAGVVLLACGRPGAAAVCGLLGVVPVGQWSLGWHRDGLWGMLRVGYDLWVASVGLLVVGSSTVWAARAVKRQPGSFDTPGLSGQGGGSSAPPQATLVSPTRERGEQIRIGDACG